MPVSKPMVLTARWYCGVINIKATDAPLLKCYCHAIDCRRATGAPVVVLAKFTVKSAILPKGRPQFQAKAGLKRRFWSKYGSSLAGRYAYLTGKLYILTGVINQAEASDPRVHALGV
jgi:hypothetical protein